MDATSSPLSPDLGTQLRQFSCSRVGICASAFLVFALLGCGSSSPKQVATQEPEKESPTDSTVRAVQSGRMEIIAKEPSTAKDGTITLEPVYKVNAEASTLDIREKGSVAGDFIKVTGNIFRDGKPGATFTAERAEADQRIQKLILHKNVKITSANKTRFMTADSVDWRSKERAFIAKGNAFVTANGLKSGPYPVLLLAPDLEKYGTPDLFRTDPTMKLLAATLASAMLTASPTLTDDKKSLVVSYRTGGVTNLTDTQIDFDVAGKPVDAKLSEQNLRINASRIVGTAKDDANKTKYLSAADITGNVRVTLSSAGITGGKKFSRETVITGGSAKWVGQPTSGDLALTGNVVMTTALKDSSQWFQVKSSRASLTLDMTQGTKDSLTSGKLSGPITFQLRTNMPTPKGTEKSEVTGSASKITFVSGTREILLTGGVKIRRVTIPAVGTQQGLNFTADTVRIVIDAQGQVKSVMAEGDPGTQDAQEAN